MTKPENLGLDSFAVRYSERALLYSEEPYELRAGGESHWYIDSKVGLASGDILGQAGGLMVAALKARGSKPEIVAGMGIGGRALATEAGVLLSETGIQMVSANDDKEDTDPLNGYGLHGADVDGKTVWVVDDTASTGDSLITLIEMVRQDGGVVDEADALVDRSRGKAAQALQELGVAFHALLEFDETTGQFIRS